MRGKFLSPMKYRNSFLYPNGKEIRTNERYLKQRTKHELYLYLVCICSGYHGLPPYKYIVILS